MKKYCHIINSKIDKIVDVLPSNWQNISNFHVLPDSELKKHGWLPVEEKTHDGTLDVGYHIQSDKVLFIKSMEPDPAIQNTIQEDLENTWAGIRCERDILLAESDKYVLFDVYEKLSIQEQQQIKTYRQQLRDIPQTYLSPEQLVWPTKPWD